MFGSSKKLSKLSEEKEITLHLYLCTQKEAKMPSFESKIPYFSIMMCTQFVGYHFYLSPSTRNTDPPALEAINHTIYRLGNSPHDTEVCSVTDWNKKLETTYCWRVGRGILQRKYNGPYSYHIFFSLCM